MTALFLDALDERVLVCDGAMGTMLYAQGVFINRCFDALNLTDPDRVAAVHQRLRARRRGRDRDQHLRRQSHQAARRSAWPTRSATSTSRARWRASGRGAGGVYVAGAIGPLGLRIEPWGKTGRDEAEAYFREQAQALVEGGVDLFMLETFRDVNEIGAAIAAVRASARCRSSRR